jgi:hypothetical protein
MKFRFILICIVAAFSIIGCRKQESADVDQNVPSDAWIALRIRGQDKTMSGFLVPLACDQNDPDWVFRYGKYCRDIWDINQVVNKEVRGKLIVTKCATCFLKGNNPFFEDYKSSVEDMLKPMRNLTAPVEVPLYDELGKGYNFFKVNGQKSTSAGFITMMLNRGLEMEDFQSFMFIRDINSLPGCWPIDKKKIMVWSEGFKYSPATNQYSRAKFVDRVLGRWTDSEMKIILKVLADNNEPKSW